MIYICKCYIFNKMYTYTYTYTYTYIIYIYTYYIHVIIRVCIPQLLPTRRILHIGQPQPPLQHRIRHVARRRHTTTTQCGQQGPVRRAGATAVEGLDGGYGGMLMDVKYLQKIFPEYHQGFHGK